MSTSRHLSASLIRIAIDDSQNAPIMPTNPRVLMIDDDALHLDVDGMIVQRAGFEPVPLLVRFGGMDSITDSRIELVLLDYLLNSVKTAPEIVQEIRVRFPDAPMVVLSDLWSPPSDVAPFITQFVRKGESAKLLEVLSSHFPGSDCLSLGSVFA